MIVIPRRKEKPVEEESQVEEKPPKTYEERYKEIFGEGKTRKDKRQLTDHRPVYMKVGVMSDARGSSYVEMGRTKVMCSIDGPREIPNLQEYTEEGLLDCDFRFAPFSSGESRDQDREPEERFLAYRLQNTLEAVVCRHEFPNFQVTININVLESDGSCLAAAVNASSLALADACLPMYDLASAVTIGLHGDTMVTDLTHDEETFCREVFEESKDKDRATISFAYLPALDQMSDLYLIGEMKSDRLTEMLDLAVENCRALSKLQHAVVLKRVQQVHFPKEKDDSNND